MLMTQFQSFWPRAIAALMVLLSCESAFAHSFGRMYNLPVPFHLYAYGAGAALVLSFLIVGYFVSAKTVGPAVRLRDISQMRWVQTLRRMRLVPILKLISVLCLLLSIATGFFGNRNPYVNFNMTFFWVVFVLGFAYLTAVIGDLYAAINPWRVVAETIERVFSGFARGRCAYPQALSYWPALMFYMAFIWIELFGSTQPPSLARMLLIYSSINLLGVWLVGKTAWFRYCEFFSVFLRLTAKMAPLEYLPSETRGERGQLRWRMPFTGLLQERAESLSLLLFVLFMLSSTAFDGLRSTVPWISLFWKDPLNLITPLIGTNPVMAFVQLRPYYLAYESLSLVLSPFLYLLIYWIFIGLAKLVTGSALSMRELALRFGYSLLPIALVYNITHYYTLIFTQGVKIVSLLSDPFGWGWNLFGTAGLWRAPIIPDMGWVWHSQVGLILFGHIVSVYLAHLEALQTFPSQRQATLSQLPMLLLMVIFTIVGLWILSQPIQSGM